ncbi:DpnI domain-containing protein [Stenoxybacter acetivorans]|uniref:DpnI domain-containing protein n=1 Tax=Stenoxybacter acetivorans TaxID=422441 RepID=UPI0005659B4A|nr:DpnI domain-containing protein [Stenoxybacter acetivorans]
MNLFFNQNLAKDYQSSQQKIRVMTEAWLAENAYCVNCATHPIKKVENNQPVKDFYCPHCHEQFELKSKNSKQIGKVISDGAYRTMLDRIQALDNPNFLFLSYQKSDYSVHQLILIPKHFFSPEMIIRRKPLSPTARRAGWEGCNIDLRFVPMSGRIALIDRQQIIPPEQVYQQWQKNLFLRNEKVQSRGWLMAIMTCIDRLVENEFSLQQMYAFEAELQQLFPNNLHVKDKIRQQLQFLRDRNMIEFIGRGRYRKR